MIALVLAILPVVPGFLRAATTPGGQVANPTFLDTLYTYAWFVTFGLSFVLSLALRGPAAVSTPWRNPRRRRIQIPNVRRFRGPALLGGRPQLERYTFRDDSRSGRPGPGALLFSGCDPLMTHLPTIAVAAALALGAAGCSKSETAQARSGEARAKPVQVEAVRQDSVRRAVDVVGTLAAVDQVTISSEADGKVSRILADLGDRVTAGQVLIQLDNEKQQYTYDQQQAALARALAQYGAPDPQHLPDDREDARRRSGPTPTSCRRSSRSIAPASSSSGRSSRSRRSTTRRRRSSRSARATTSALQNAKNLRASIQASEATMKLAGPAAPRHRDPRAVRRLRREAARQPGRAGQDADAGHGGRAARPAEGDRRDSREDGALDQRRPGGRSAGRRVPGPDVHRQGLAHQPRREHRDARVSVRGAGAERRHAC